MMRTGETDHLSLDQLEAWFNNAQVGDRIVYATGDVQHDRGMFVHPGSAIAALRELAGTDMGTGAMLAAVAARALQLQACGVVWLFQRRLAENRFAYIAVRKPARRRHAHGARVPEQVIKDAMAELAGRVIAAE